MKSWMGGGQQRRKESRERRKWREVMASYKCNLSRLKYLLIVHDYERCTETVLVLLIKGSFKSKQSRMRPDGVLTCVFSEFLLTASPVMADRNETAVNGMARVFRGPQTCDLDRGHL